MSDYPSIYDELVENWERLGDTIDKFGDQPEGDQKGRGTEWDALKEVAKDREAREGKAASEGKTKVKDKAKKKKKKHREDSKDKDEEKPDEEKPPAEEQPPVEEKPPVVVNMPIQEAINNARPGDVLDFGWKRTEHTETVVIPADADITLVRLFLYGPGLTPDKPSLWAKESERVRLVRPIIVGSADTGGKWGRETGSKQHGGMFGAVTGEVVIEDALIALTGADWLTFTDKPGKLPCSNVRVLRPICIRSRRQGISPSGVRGLLIEDAITSDCQRTLFDFESEGGGAHDVRIVRGHYDCFTRQPNAVISIGGADRTGDTGETVANLGPFILDGLKVYGHDLTTDNRSQGELRLLNMTPKDNYNLPPGDFPDLRKEIEQRFPGVAGLADLVLAKPEVSSE